MPTVLKKFDIPEKEPTAYPIETQKGDHGDTLIVVQCKNAEIAWGQEPRKVAALAAQFNDEWQKYPITDCDYGSYAVGGITVVNKHEPDRKVTPDELMKYGKKDKETLDALRWRITFRCLKGNR